MGKASKGPPASHRSYPRLTLDDRRGIERGLDKRESLAEIARRLGRATSTVSRKVARNTVFSRPRASSGERWSAEPPEGGLRLAREGAGRLQRLQAAAAAAAARGRGQSTAPCAPRP